MAKKTGTREWSDISKNAGTGCEHQCRYCYARYNTCVRYKRTTVEAHKTFVPNNKRIDANAKKESGIIMFPTQHDITPDNLSQCMTMIRKNLDIGNKMLIVSKAHLECFKIMCTEYTDYKDQLEFRVTIGSVLDDVLSFWEGGVPSFDERLSSLALAFSRGYKTSVSCEPMLDGLPMYTYEACLEYITEGFWIGLMNKIDQRCDFTGVSDGDMTKYVDIVRRSCNKSFIETLHCTMRTYPKIRWKDSITTLLGLEESE